jgi:hypothetical protein
VRLAGGPTSISALRSAACLNPISTRRPARRSIASSSRPALGTHRLLQALPDRFTTHIPQPASVPRFSATPVLTPSPLGRPAPLGLRTPGNGDENLCRHTSEVWVLDSETSWCMSTLASTWRPELVWQVIERAYRSQLSLASHPRSLSHPSLAVASRSSLNPAYTRNLPSPLTSHRVSAPASGSVWAPHTGKRG